MTFQFRYATGFDYLLMSVGTVCAIAHGACQPTMLLLFGEMADVFIEADDPDYENRTYLLEQNCSWEQFGWTWDDIDQPDGDIDKLE